MQMINAIVQEVAKQLDANLSEVSELNNLMTAALAETTRLGLTVPRDRWLAMGVHMLGFLRRMRSGETLPPVEKELYAEIPPEMLHLAGRVLAAAGSEREAGDAEVFLMAVHFEAARALQQVQP